MYRLTVVAGGFPVGASDALRPVAIASLIRLVRPDGSSVPDDTAARRPEIAAFRTTGIAAVRVALPAGGPDQMAPVDGWSAFAARTTVGAELFGMKVDGLDEAGRVIATSLPYRCC